MAKKRSKKRWKLTDEQWAKIEPLLPKLKKSKHSGRPWIDNRRVFEGYTLGTTYRRTLGRCAQKIR